MSSPPPHLPQSQAHTTQALFSDSLCECLSLKSSVEFPKALQYLRVAGTCESRLGTCPACLPLSLTNGMVASSRAIMSELQEGAQYNEAVIITTVIL